MTDVNGTIPQEPMVTITQKEYQKLLDCSSWLEFLEGSGIDSWEGYEHAWHEYH